ncbi:MAG: hypothetical protein KJ737_13690 [Proteobacteria bacterium]|nr:hypothetical protein [Pseudomonadota bacterium]
MDIKVIRKNRRKKDRRKKKGPYNGPERRSGKDRRKLDEKLHLLIEENEKKQAIQDRIKSQSGAGSIIRRRKNGQNERVKACNDSEGQ